LTFVLGGRNKLGCQLPTWVPDWTSRSTDLGIQKLLLLTHDCQNLEFNAAKDTKAVTEFRHCYSESCQVEMRFRDVFVIFLDQQDEAAEDNSEVSVFSTGGTHTIIAHPKALIDDEVWVLHGASKPVLLRPEGSDTYSFLGQVFVYDKEEMKESEIMYGEILEEVHKVQDIWII
jgi:hypothetical protein